MAIAPELLRRIEDRGGLDQTVRVLSLDTRAAARFVSRFESLLSPDEIDRANRFHFDHSRASYIVTRGTLRILLGRYLGVEPRGVALQYGANGKPGLRAADPLRFNVSHSGHLAAFAFTSACEAGIDIEEIRPMSDLDEVAQRFFCPEEAEEVSSMPAGERDIAFFRCWTRKEAYIKADGRGLAIALDSFRVSIGPEARFIHEPEGKYGARGWLIRDLHLAPGYAAAVAYGDFAGTVETLPVLEPAVILELR